MADKTLLPERGAPAHVASRQMVTARGGADVTRDAGRASAVLTSLPEGTIVLVAERRVGDTGPERARIACPGGWVDASDLASASPAPRHTLDMETFLERHMAVEPGDLHGLAFPFTLEAIERFGAAFFTEAFRAAGTIGPDNAVTAIVELRPLGIPGASENAFLTLAYARDEVGLSTELFVKVPPADPPHKFGLLPMAKNEVDFYTFANHTTLPITVPRLYFGDHSARTGNYIIVTERIGFGKGAVEPAYRKGYDQFVPDARAHYHLLARSIGRLAAAHKSGALGVDLDRHFPFPHGARDFGEIKDAEGRIDRLIDFVGRIAPHLFPPEARRPAFLRQWREDLLFGLEHKDKVIAYLHADADYTALCHPNLNIDNAWFWKDAEGSLHAGLFDWGGAGQMSIGQALSGMLMMPDPDMHLSLVQDVMRIFIEEYAHGCGIVLDPATLELHYKASLYSTAMCTIVSIIIDYLGRFSDEEYKAMSGRFDPVLQDSGFAPIIIWIDNMLREWLQEMTPGDAWRHIVSHA